MAFIVSVKREPEHSSEWVDYKDSDGNVLGKFKINGINNKAYQVSLQRVIEFLESTEGTQVGVNETPKYKHEYFIEAAATHLLTDWDADIQLSFDDGKTYTKVDYTPKNAINFITNESDDLSFLQWVRTEATRIQKEADEKRAELLGK